MAELTKPRVFKTGVVSGRALLRDAPAMWSYSALKDVGGCPRRYALSRADYPDLWEHHGYPRLPVPAAIRGDVVHGALEIIIKALVAAGCTTIRSTEAVAVLRALGGYTKVAEDVLSRQLAQFNENPRISTHRRDQLARQLMDWISQAREQIQTYLCRIEISPTVAPAADIGPSDPKVRYPARNGDHPEIELVAESLRLKGRIDLLKVETDGAQITDFKTGTEDPAHRDQLNLYALLWSEDNLVNPDGLAVTKLTVAYPNSDITFTAPTNDELSELRAEVQKSIAQADAAADSDSPIANVGDHCGQCAVRGLCSSYWTSGTAAKTTVADGVWYDLEGTVLRRHGVKSFVLEEARTSMEVFIRTPTASYVLPVNRDIRILGARRVVDPDQDGSHIAAVASTTEIFELDQHRT